MRGAVGAVLAAFVASTLALRYDPEQVLYNLNQNKDAVHPVDYDGKWQDHQFNPSPENWRFPFYTLFLDRFVNGNPDNGNLHPHLWCRDLC